jgi:putative peptidoglycan lipid II flippase
MSPIRRITNLFYQSHNLKQAVGILFVTVLISNVLGLIRNIIIANRVGVTYGSIGPLDNYYAAFVLPDFLYSILIVGALSSAILPLLVKIDTEENDQKFWQTFNTLLSTGFTAIIFGLAALYFMLPWLMPRLFPGFSDVDIRQTTELAQAMLLSPLFFTVSQLSTSALQAKKMFFAPALAPIVYNVSIITGALLIPRFGLPVLVFGVILGAAAHFLVQLPSLLRLGWRFSFEISFGSGLVRQVFKLMIPRTIALTSTQLLLIAFYRIASDFSAGSIAIYRLTDDLQTAPVLLLANTLAMAILPDFTRKFAKDQKEEYQQLVGKALRLLLFIFLPATIYLLLFRTQIIGLYISIGHSIDPAETIMAIKTFSYFVISIFFQGAVLLLARAYFARSDTMRPTVYSICSIAVALLFAWWSARATSLGVAGLALAFSIGSIINALLLWSTIGVPLRSFLYDTDGKKNVLLVLAGGLMTTAVFAVAYVVSPTVSALFTSSPSAQNLIELLFGLAVGLLFYFVWSKVFNLEQWQMIRNRRSTQT